MTLGGIYFGKVELTLKFDQKRSNATAIFETIWQSYRQMQHFSIVKLSKAFTL